uniref:Uncharacterized protein n=1 Tax=Anguilla anguilla TaxID=7936 RepID=A0A0E9W695_ANGAN
MLAVRRWHVIGFSLVPLQEHDQKKGRGWGGQTEPGLHKATWHILTTKQHDKKQN